MGALKNQPSTLTVGEPLAKFPRALAQEATPGTKVMVVADSAVAGRLGKTLRGKLQRAGFDARLAVVPSGERSKTLAQAETLG